MIKFKKITTHYFKSDPILLNLCPNTNEYAFINDKLKEQDLARLKLIIP